jgi:broad specificity phosphatase PhoE
MLLRSERVSGNQFWDARLTPTGEEQCCRLRNEIHDMPHKLDLELVVVSPLTRTLQTAELSLGRADAPGEH